MRPNPAHACLAVLAVCVATVPARAEPTASARVDNWAGMRAALAKCWAAPAGPEGSLLAYRFGLDKAGAIQGKPLITARQLKGDAAAQRHFEAATDAALAKCFPMPVTPSFGAVLGDSPINLRFVNTPPTDTLQLDSNITVFAPR